MSVTVRVPTTLRTLTGGESEVAVAGDTVGEVLSALETAHPGFRERILDENGKLRRFVNVFVSDDDIRFLDGLSTKVPDGETVAIIPAVAGGCYPVEAEARSERHNRMGRAGHFDQGPSPSRRTPCDGAGARNR